MYASIAGYCFKIFKLSCMIFKKTLVLGASENPGRYSNLAIRKLRSYKHPVIAIGRKNGIVDDVPITSEKNAYPDIDTVTVYLNEVNQQEYYDYILNLAPKRIIFNPGAENSQLTILAKNKGIQVINACTLVMLSTGQY